jgi:hypothetical protein
LGQNFANLTKNKSPEKHGRRNIWENFQRKHHIFKEEGYEIAKIFGGFREISSFLLFEIAKFS